MTTEPTASTLITINRFYHINTQDYLTQKNISDLYFWYQARKILIDDLLKSKLGNFSPDRKILDIGCGTGTELEILKKYGQVSGLDIDDSALNIIKTHGCLTIKGDIESIHLEKDSFDCICCFDVLEHLRNDQAVLEKIYASLRPDGYIFFTAPTFSFLFSTHDKFSGHLRRYSRKELQTKLFTAGFQNIDLNYWNFLLFFPIALIRFIKKIIFINTLKAQKFSTDAKPLNSLLNKFLFLLLNLENLAIKNNIRFPFGLTIFGSAKK